MKASKNHPKKPYEVGPFGILRLKNRGAVVTDKIIQELSNEADDSEYKKVVRDYQIRRVK